MDVLVFVVVQGSVHGRDVQLGLTTSHLSIQV